MLIEAKGLSKQFEGRTLFRDVDLLISPKSRLALLGDNGCGKSTLVRALLGLEEPTSGTIRRADKLNVAYFEQNRETVDPTKSVMQNVCPDGDYVSFRGEFVHVRSYLDRFLFSGSKVDLPAAKLSGGEQARLRLAQLMLQPAQVLVLDEPTNDLDGETLDVLEGALAEFNGAVILVTHDRFFMDAVATEIVAFPPPDSDQTNLTRFASYFQWEAWFADETARIKRGEPSPVAEAAPTPAAPKVKLSNKEKFELEKMEETILKLETELAALTERSTSPELMSNHKKLTEVHAQLGQAQATLDRTYQRWTELEAKSKA
jgi:ATP-binding cassette subfamily F protein uup